MCRLVHRGPRPQAMLRPLHLELQVYVAKTRSKQKHRYCWNIEKDQFCVHFVAWQANLKNILRCANNVPRALPGWDHIGDLITVSYQLQ